MTRMRHSLDLSGYLVKLAIAGAGALSIASGFTSSVSAQGGQTEVTKTVPSAPASPPVAAQPPVAQPAAPAAQTVSPIGSGSAWQPSVASPTQPAAAIQATDIELVDKANGYFNKMTNLQGTFVQTDPDNKQKRGRFYFERPGKVRFDYGSPSKLKIISDGEYLAIEDHDLKTSDRYPLEMTAFRLLLAQKVDLGNDARIVAVDKGPEAIVITVEDKKGDGGGRIRLFFNKTDMSLKEWIITDPQGADTRVEVANLEQNKQVSATLFEFTKNLGFKSLNQ